MVEEEEQKLPRLKICDFGYSKHSLIGRRKIGGWKQPRTSLKYSNDKANTTGERRTCGRAGDVVRHVVWKVPVRR